MGVRSGPDEKKLGLDGSSTTVLMLDDVHVPVENVLGTIGEGHKVAFNILNLGRVKLGTRNIAGARQALNNSIRYAKDRRQFGRAIAEFGLVKQKLAEMAIRCFVGDAMVYRTLGDVDRALEHVDAGDAGRILKTIESFAIECSINKVWTSETLGFAVDEAIQVYGGNGYSREFPVERAYRDARITRIYEGTNEINRLIIPTRLLKLSASLFTAENAQQTLDSRDTVSSDGPLAAERALLARAKRLAIATLGFAAGAFGDDLKNQQEVMGHTADVVIETYASESVIARAEKGAPNEAVHALDIARIYVADAADRTAHSARQVAAALSGGPQAALRAAIAGISTGPSFDIIAARRRIADAVISAGRYPF